MFSLLVCVKLVTMFSLYFLWCEFIDILIRMYNINE